MNSLLTTIRNQGEEIEVKDKEIIRLKTKIEKMEAAEQKANADKPAAKKPAAKKPAAAKKSAAKKPAAKKAE